VENWGSFMPEKDGRDIYAANVAAGTEIGERAQKYIDAGIAKVVEQADGSRTVTYHGTERGRHLPLGDVQKCAMGVLKYLLGSLAWKDMMKTMEE